MEELDLRELAYRESEQVEWKENVADIDDVVATLSAFANDWANLGGGYVVCGAAEGRDEHGFAVLHTRGLDAARFKEIHGKVMQLCRDQVTPPIVPLVHELPTEDPSRRILVFVMPATRHAHSFRRRADGGAYYIRQSRSTIKARNGLFRELMVRKGDLEPWDHRMNPEARVEDVDLVVLRDALQRTAAWDGSRALEDYLRADQQLSALMPSLCASEPLTNTTRPRNFTLLLFGHDVPRFVPGAHVVFSAYPGVDRSEPHSEVYFVYGPLLEQIRALKERLSGHAHMVIDKEDSVSPNAVKYPLRALEEAVVNALVHRDYGDVHPTHVTVFSDRVEIVSPGGLPSRVDPNEFRGGTATPVWRNQALAWFCRELHLAQALGQGVATIFRTMQDAGCPLPEYTLAPHSVRCVLRAHPRATRGALTLEFDAKIVPPDGVGLSSVFAVPARGSATDWSRLRSVPVDVAAWEAAMDEIDRGLEGALEGTRGDLHVFVMAPYAAAVFLGRRLADLARARPLHLHQLSLLDGRWDSFSRPHEASHLPAEPYFEPLQEPSAASAVSAILLAVDGMHPIAEPWRDHLAERLGAATYHLQSRSLEPMHTTQMPGAVTAVRRTLAIIGRRHPGIPLHIVTSAPVALIVELGRQLTPAVFPSAIVYHLDVTSATYVPVLDVIRRKVVPPNVSA
jgi:ATP-dependent DNA helicase RecG